MRVVIHKLNFEDSHGDEFCLLDILYHCMIQCYKFLVVGFNVLNSLSHFEGVLVITFIGTLQEAAMVMCYWYMYVIFQVFDPDIINETICIVLSLSRLCYLAAPKFSRILSHRIKLSSFSTSGLEEV